MALSAQHLCPWEWPSFNEELPFFSKFARPLRNFHDNIFVWSLITLSSSARVENLAELGQMACFPEHLEVGMRMEMYSSSSRLKWEQVELQTYWCPVFHHVDHRSEVCQCGEREKIDLKQRIWGEGEGKSLDCRFTALFQMFCRPSVLSSWISARHSCSLQQIFCLTRLGWNAVNCFQSKKF